jgi:hypothetical protein
MKKLTLFLFTSSIIIISCNKIDTTKEIFQFIGPVEVTAWDHNYAQTVVQKIYIEEFTGHLCPNCPTGAQELKAIMEKDSTVITTAIHSTFFANPGNPPYFEKDYKTPMGDQICKDFNISALPQAMINRIHKSNVWEIGVEKWRSRISEIDRNNIRAGIQMKCSIDTIKQEIEAKLAVTIIKELPNPVHLCLVLQQDNFISGQKKENDYILEYVHNHVLRVGFNGNYGTKLTSNGLVTKQLKYSSTFKILYGDSFPYSNLPVEIHHCSVVAYLIDMETKEVIQVECLHLQ